MKKARLVGTGMIALLFAMSVTLSSCGSDNKSNDESGAAQEQPAADDGAKMDSTAVEEHPASEHPEGGNEEHPAADSTAAGSDEHPAN